MNTKEKIQVCIIENDTKAQYIFNKLFEDNENYDVSFIKIQGNDSTNVEKTRKEDKDYIIKELTKKTYQILIFDLLLRDKMSFEKEEVFNSDLSGIKNLLSFEIARYLKNKENKERFLLLFTSSSEICKSHQDFEFIRDQYGDIVPEDAGFIFKPNINFEKRIRDCPVDTGTNEPACNMTERDENGCTKKQCFFELLNKYYKEFMEENNEK